MFVGWWRVKIMLIFVYRIPENVLVENMYTETANTYGKKKKFTASELFHF